MRALKLAAICMALIVSGASAEAQRDGSPERPLQVLLIPADGGTADGTRADFKPLFDAITVTSGLHFEITAGQSYAAVIEGMCTGLADLAWFGPVSYLQARNRGCAELLAVEERAGSATYHAGLFVASSSDIKTIEDLRGRSLALGSIHSASSFAFPLAMISGADLNPLTDLALIRITGSHTNSLMALKNGQVDAAGASFVSFERAINQGGLEPSAFRILGKSTPIPNPPIAVRSDLSDPVKRTLRTAIASVHTEPDINPETIRGYGGKRVDRYNINIDDATLDQAAETIAFIDDDFRAAMLRAAAASQQ